MDMLCMWQDVWVILRKYFVFIATDVIVTEYMNSYLNSSYKLINGWINNCCNKFQYQHYMD